jgi:hypothetical protein
VQQSEDTMKTLGEFFAKYLKPKAPERKRFTKPVKK